MTVSTKGEPTPAIIQGYQPSGGVYDEMCAPDGRLRPHWEYLIDAVAKMGPAGLEARRREAGRLIRDNGVTYNVYGDPRGVSRPWELDLLPLLIPSSEWSLLERGLIQRAELLNQIALDLYGPQRLIERGLLPPELVYSHPGFLPACYGVHPILDRPLVFYAADLTRTAEGGWRVVADRAQSPSGAGYALENRLVLSRVMPSLFRDSHVHRLAGFFRVMRRTLNGLAPRPTERTRIAVLTSGPSNEAHFEHAYLANYLGYSLVQGGDLTVRDGAVWLKTLERLERIDVVLRRLDDLYCDPLELKEDSLLGVPGLVQAARSGNVALANALGTGILEHPALAAFLPGIAEELLGEELLVPGVPTHWCGDPDRLNFVLSNLGKLFVRSVQASPRSRPLLGSELTAAEMGALKQKIRARPYLYVAQEPTPLSTTPVLVGERLESRPATLRGFLVAGEDGYTLMPGGLARVGQPSDGFMVSHQLGGAGKDTWVIASEPERQDTLLVSAEKVPPFAPRGESEVSSRVADNLFWIGRYAERAEGLVRLLRILIIRLTERMSVAATQADLKPMRSLFRALTEQTLTYPGFVGEGAEGRLKDPVPEMLSLITDTQRAGGLPQTLQALGQAARSVRDRLSADTWRIVDDIDHHFHALIETPATELARTLDALDPLVTTLAAFAALSHENLVRNEGWRFLQTGRRLERGVNTTALLQATLVPVRDAAEENLIAETLLAVTDSLITYRRRYQQGTAVGGLLDLVLQDENNPRSLAYQLAEIDALVKALPRPHASGQLSSAEKLVLRALSAVRLSEVVDLVTSDNGERGRLAGLLGEVRGLLAELSDTLAAQYIRHEERPHSLLRGAEASAP